MSPVYPLRDEQSAAERPPAYKLAVIVASGLLAMGMACLVIIGVLSFYEKKIPDVVNMVATACATGLPACLMAYLRPAAGPSASTRG